MRWLIEKKLITAGFIVALAILIMDATVVYNNTLKVIETGNILAKSQETLHRLQDIYSILNDADIGAHGYLLTGKDHFLDLYANSVLMIDKEIGDLRKLTADNPKQQKMLDLLEPMIDQILNILREEIALLENRKFKITPQLVMTNKEDKIRQDVRSIIAEIEKEESRLLKVRDEDLNANSQNSIRVLMTGNAVSITLLFLVFYFINSEVTKRKRTEDELRNALSKVKEEKAKSEAIIAAIGDTISIQDTNYKILYQNRINIERMGGHVGEYCYNAYQHRDIVCEGCHLEMSFQDGEIRTVERCVHTDKGERHVEITVSPLRDSTGKIIAGIEIVRDITKRKWAEIEYKTILSTVMDGFWLVDAQGRFLDVNDAYCNLAGYSRDEMLKMSVPDVEAAETPEDTAQHIKTVIKEGSDRFDTRHRCKDGRIVDIEVCSKYLDLEDGKFFVFLRDITERKQKEQELKNAHDELERKVDERTAELSLERNKLKRILDTMNDGVYIVNKKYGIEYINPVIEKEFGSAIGRKCYEYFHDRTEVCPWCKNQEVFAGKSVQWEWFSSKTGKTYELFDTPIRNADGSVSKLEIFHDITERKQVEESLKESQRAYQALAENLPGIVYRVFIREKKRMQFFNKEAEIITGYTDNELTSGDVCSIDPLIVSEDRTKIVADVERAIAEKKPFMVEYRLTHKDCGVRYLLEQGTPIFGEDGEPLYVDGVIFDITERKRMEDMLRQSEANLVEAQRIAHFGGWNWNILTNELRWSDEIYRIFGLTPQEFGATYEAFLDTVHPEDKEFVKKSVNEALNEQKTYDIDHRIIRPDGVERIVHEKGEITYDNTGRPVQMVGTVHDITEERERELRLILNERLASLGVMASSIAHEINNPLASISGCAEGLLSRLKKDQYDPVLFENYLKIMEEEIFRCKNITTGMLSYVKGNTYEQKECNINEILNKSVEIIEFQGRLKRIEVINDLSDDLPVILGSEGELRQVIITILTNAIDAMEEKGTLTISTSHEANTRRVFIKISDTGSGIPPEYFNRIFEPLFTTKSESGGTGLGLSIARKIIQNHHGNIDVISEKGIGSTFKITIPT